MYDKELEAFSEAAVGKYNLAKNTPAKFFMSAILAGFYIVVATILSNVTAAVFYESNPSLAKFLGAFLFSLAIILIVFVGGELFTGNNMTMAMGVYNKKCTWGQSLIVWICSYIGNFIGAFFLGGLVVLSGSAKGILTTYYEAIVPGKLDLDPLQLFIRGVLCNYLVCMAVFVGKRLQTETAKLVLMFCIITAFVIAGFEHSIANMGTFTIAGFLLGGLDAMALLKSFVFVTLGNIVGGAFLFALPLKLVSSKTK